MENFTSVYAKDNGVKRLKSTLKDNGTVKLYNDNKYESDVYSGLFDKRSWIDEDKVWHVYPIAIKEHGQHADVYIICPICGMIHSHGVSVNDDIPIHKEFPIENIHKLHPRYGNFGHRVAHCNDYLCTPEKNSVYNGYIIEGITIEDAMKYMPNEND